MVSNEVIIAAIGAFTTIVTAFLTYLTVKIQQVKKLVDGTATLLAEQTARNTEKALDLADKRVEAARKTGTKEAELIAQTKEIVQNTKKTADNTDTRNRKE